MAPDFRIESGHQSAQESRYHSFLSMSSRRERRAQAGKKLPVEARKDIPLSQPSRNVPSHKTLLDIANERQLLHISSQSTPSITATRINSDGSLTAPEIVAEASDSSETPYLDVALYTATLTFLHFTLTVLVNNQYATHPPSVPDLFYSSTIASPTPALLLILVAILHPHSARVITQLLFGIMSVVAGAWLVHASNEDPYMAVMKKAPPLGTLWVWAVVEMRWESALGCLGLVGSWTWWKGYAIY